MLDHLPPIRGLSFVEDGHRYTWQSSRYGLLEPPSVSKVLEGTGAKCMNWAGWRNSLVRKGMTVEQAEAHMEEHRQRRATVGSLAHGLIALRLGNLQGEPLEDDPTEEARIFWTWAREFLPLIESTRLIEQPLIHRGGFYVGTPDLLATINGMLTVVDWKTAQPKKERIRLEWRLQLAAYAAMIESCYGIKPEQGMNVVISEDRCMVKTWNAADLDLGWRQFAGFLLEYHAAMTAQGSEIHRIAWRNLLPLFDMSGV